MNFYYNPDRIHAAFAKKYVDLERASGVDGADWEHFQYVLLNDDSKLSIWRKSRQVAFSFTSATEAVLDALICNIGSIFVSINLEEAKEKIRYARAVYESIHSVRVPRLIRDNELSLEFEHGPRLESLPAKPPRGKGRRNVYLDEFAHVRLDREIYKGALPVISKGGRLRIGSSTMGASGMFWEIDTESMQSYPGYTRIEVPWWHVKAFCPETAEARMVAPMMTTYDRVMRYGNEVIQMIYSNMPEEDFQQEYETVYVDEVHAWFSWDEIKSVQDADLLFKAVQVKGSSTMQARDAIDWLAHQVQTGKAESVMGAGVDIGRKRNTTELFIGGASTTGSMPLRLAITMDNTPFRQQEDLLRYAVQRLPLKQMLIDQNGIGMNLAENLSEDYPVKVVGAQFTAQHKVLWSTDAKMHLTKGRTPLPMNRDIAYQIHSIKRKVTSSNNLVFDTDKNEKHHADKYWAWALMLSAIIGRISSTKVVVQGSATVTIR